MARECHYSEGFRRVGQNLRDDNKMTEKDLAPSLDAQTTCAVLRHSALPNSSTMLHLQKIAQRNASRRLAQSSLRAYATASEPYEVVIIGGGATFSQRNSDSF